MASWSSGGTPAENFSKFDFLPDNTILIAACAIRMIVVIVLPLLQAFLLPSLLPSLSKRSSFLSMRSSFLSMQRHDWTSPTWGWGYANGDAHDAAALLRRRLRDSNDRRNFLSDSNTAPDELILALMLAIQRRGPRGGAGEFWDIYIAIAEGSFGSCNPPNPELTTAIQEVLLRADPPPPSSPDGALLASLEYSSDDESSVLKKALCVVQLVEKSL